MKERKLIIVIPENAKFDEVVDSIADVLECGIEIESQLQDGFQFKDLMVAIGLQPKIMEVINDGPLFIEQFLKLNADTAIKAVQMAKDRIVKSNREIGKVTNYIIKFLFVAANNYSYALNGQKQYELWQNLINGNDVFTELKE